MDDHASKTIPNSVRMRAFRCVAHKPFAGLLAHHTGGVVVGAVRPGRADVSIQILPLFTMADLRGVAQSGSAPHWGCGGRRFKSCRPDQLKIIDSYTYTKQAEKLYHPNLLQLGDCNLDFDDDIGVESSFR